MVESPQPVEFDCFISYVASEGGHFASALASELTSLEQKVWIDETQILIGDSIRQAIDAGIARSRSGVVLISPSFLERQWPASELDALIQMRASNGNPVFPVLFEVNIDEVKARSPLLASIRAASFTEGARAIAEQIAQQLSRRSADEVPTRGALAPAVIVAAALEGWGESETEVATKWAAAPHFDIRAVQLDGGSGRLADLKERMHSASQRSNGQLWPMFQHMTSETARWNSSGFFFSGLTDQYWHIRPNGDFFFSSSRVNWYQAEGRVGFGFQMALYWIAQALIFASRLSRLPERESGHWRFTIAMRNAEGMALVADHRGGTLSLDHKASQPEIEEAFEFRFPTSRAEIVTALSGIVNSMFWPFTVSGDAPLPTGLSARTLESIAGANQFWEDCWLAED